MHSCVIHINLRLSVLTLLFLGLFCSFAPGQPNTSTGAIHGKVTIQGNTALPDAKVILTFDTAHLDLPVNENGEYSITGLFPGTYSLSVSAYGYATQVFEPLNVRAGGELTLDATLKPGSAEPNSAVEASAQSGQEENGVVGGKTAISGTVTDQTQAVIGDAKAVLTAAGGHKLESPVDKGGIYSFKDLSPGVYTLTVSAPNFEPKVFDNINVTTGLELTLDASLEPAQAKEEVNVESSGIGQVETESSTVSGTITKQEVVSIGLNGRNFSQLIALAPGVSNQTGQDEAKVGVQGSVKYSVNGGRVEYNSFEIDGNDVLNAGLNGASTTLMVYPSLDAIQEMKVLTSNYGAQYGRTASGTVQVTTKSGTSQLHGNLYDFIRNEAFNSRNYFDVVFYTPPPLGQLNGEKFGGKAPLYRRQDFGGTIGGPLYIPRVFNTNKDKTFFFFSEEVRLEKTPIDYSQAVPGLKERGLVLTPQGAVQPNIKNAGGVIYQDFDFSDVCPVTGGFFLRPQFPDCPSVFQANGFLQSVSHLEQPLVSGAQESNGGVDKNALLLLNSNLIPLPNAPFGCNFQLPSFSINQLDPSDPNRCFITAVSPSTYWREELFRIDQILTSKLKISFRYIHDAWDTTVLSPQWSYLSQTHPEAATFPTVQNRFVGPGLSLVGRLTQTISPTLLNDVVLSYANSSITLKDQNGNGGAQFQRNPRLDLPLVVTNPLNPAMCNPAISVDPATNIPECAIGHLFDNGFGGKNTGMLFLGTNAAYGGRGFAADPSYMPWGHTNPTFSLRDDIGWARGKHTFQFGAQYIYSQRNQDNNAINAASGDTQGLLTFSNLTHSTGNAFADFLFQTIQLNGGVAQAPQSFIQSFSQDSAQHRYYQRFSIIEPYFQDDWKITKRLTLNLGLRLSIFGTYTEKNRNAWNWEASRFDSSAFSVGGAYGELLYHGSAVPVSDLAATDPSGVIGALGLVRCGFNGTPSSCMQGHLFNPAPRIGFAWDPKGDGKTSIRAGYGIFFEHGTGNEANTGSLEASAPLVVSMTQQLPLSYPCIGDIGYGSGSNPECATIFGGTPPPAGSAFPIDVTSIPTRAIWPYAQQWSFGIQRELHRNTVANMAYVGSKGTKLTVERQLNQLQPLLASENPFGPNEPLTKNDCIVDQFGHAPGDGSYLPPGDGTNPFLLQSGVLVSPTSPAYVYLQAACTNPNIPNVNSLAGRPYPGLGRVLSLQNVANSSYHAFQATLRHTSGGLTAGVSYSYSHSIDDASDRSDPILVDSYDLRENRASSSFDERHLLNINYIYQLPLMWLPRHFMDWANATPEDQSAPRANCCSSFTTQLLEGWELSGVTLFASGTPFTIINSAGNTGISLTDNAGVSSGLGLAASYPDIAKGLPSPGSNSQSFGPLIGNPSQFVAPRGLTFGTAGRNYLNNPHRLNLDISLLKHFNIRESRQLEFRAEGFNIFNNTQFRIYDPDNPGSTGNNIISCYAGPNYSAGFIGAGADCVTGASFLHPLNAHRPRTIQFGMKLSF